MSPLEPGAALPDVTLDGPEGPVRLRDAAAAGPLVVAFYAEDATPTCTAQLCTFRDDFALIREIGATLVAISADGTASHARFAAAHGFPFPLLSDPDLVAARAFGVMAPEGRRSVRAVFVADGSGTIRAALPHYNPANLKQYEAIFRALGVGLG